MPNTIKRSGDGLALQVTKPARAAGFVEETDDDLGRINDVNFIELVTSAALDTVSIHRVTNASLQIAGNGY
ncbi:hypothetical protein [Haladaptatus sp. DYF46]|uniref:hypothetical protein n=1 Tax=Haladaptatus sp. DYF46 TaxID=2886041 RepID=UPI001E612B0B|nr:hypothetical protein [Haladaptatus sp. DYF46]